MLHLQKSDTEIHLNNESTMRLKCSFFPAKIVLRKLSTSLKIGLTVCNSKFLCVIKLVNEMVSLGDTAISLHILQPPLMGGGFWKRSDLDSGKKIRVLKFGGGSRKSKPKVPRSSLNLNFWGVGWGGILEPNSRTGVFWRIWSKFSGSPVFSLTLAQSPMASRSYWRASDFFKLLARISQ